MRMIDTAVARLPDVEREYLKQTCNRCPRSLSRGTIVWGIGNRSAEILVVGGSPDLDEDKQGLPFVGESADLLEKVWADVGIKREELFLTFISKCYVPDSREPTIGEGAACAPYLIRELLQVRPKIVVTLGSVAYWGLTGEALIGGETPPVVRKVLGKAEGAGFDILIVPTISPSEILRVSLGKTRDELMQRVTADWQLVGNMRSVTFERAELKLV